MDDTFQLPFYVPKSQLPAPLPTWDEIERCDDVIVDQTGRRVVRVNEHYIVKYGVSINLVEGLNVLAASAVDSEAVPKVFALHTRDNASPGDPEVKFIVMENVAGKTFDAVWPTLSTSEKGAIAGRLRVFFDALRLLPAPGYYGSIGRRQYEESMFWTPKDAESSLAELINGPFDTESQLNEAFVNKYTYNTGLKFKAQYYRRTLPRVLKDHRPVFTHGDFQRKNIIIRPGGEPVVIDWEVAGWYPEYWDYASGMFACGRWRDDWHDFLAKIFDEYPNEYAWFEMIRREVWS